MTASAIATVAASAAALADGFTEQEVIASTVDIVTAYVSNNAVSVDSLSSVITQVAAATRALYSTQEPVAVEVAPQEPAVSVRKSITPDFLICLEDGRKFKSLKRHLRTKYNLSPEDYRAKWNLPSDYPMVAPNYAAARSELAKQMGLGIGGRKPARATKATKATKTVAAA